MPEPKKTLKLTKAWGKHPLGATLTVLEPGDPVTRTTVDPARAAALLKAGIAVDPSAAPVANATIQLPTVRTPATAFEKGVR